MAFTLKCPHCDRRFEAEDELLGSTIQCPRCSASLVAERLQPPRQAAYDFVTLTCPRCGGKLEVTKDMERFACAHCGTEHLVLRRGGTVSLAPVMEGIRQVKDTVDRTAAELAIVRLEKEIGVLQTANDEETNSLVVVVGVVLVGVPLAIVAAWHRQLYYAALIGVVLCVAGFLGRGTGKERRKQRTLELTRKKHELATNRQIVSS